MYEEKITKEVVKSILPLYPIRTPFRKHTKERKKIREKYDA
jgi:hypothetical protein